MPPQTPVYNAGESRRTFGLILAVSCVFFGMWAYIFVHQKPRVADGAIQAITVVPLHTELRQGGTMSEGYGGGVQKSDELYVWVAFEMKNLTSDVPLYATQQRATLTLPDAQHQFAYDETQS